MSDDKSTTTYVNSGSGGGLYFIVGALVIIVLVGGYFLIGMPGLNTSQGSGSTPQKVDVTITAPAAPAVPAAKK